LPSFSDWAAALSTSESLVTVALAASISVMRVLAPITAASATVFFSLSPPTAKPNTPPTSAATAARTMTFLRPPRRTAANSSSPSKLMGAATRMGAGACMTGAPPIDIGSYEGLTCWGCA
jgi:hypothetical protein